MTATAPQELLDRLQGYIGAGSDRPGKAGRVVVNGPFIQQFTDIIGDRNPVYTDERLAEESIHGQIVAPPVALSMWRLRGLEPAPGATWIDANGARRFRQDPNGVRVRGEDARTIRDELNDLLGEYGYSSPVVTNERFEYRRYLRLGDRLTFGSPVIAAIAGPKQTKLGEGFFITLEQTVTDAAGETVAVVEQRYLRFQPAPKVGETNAEAAKTPAPTRQATEPPSGPREDPPVNLSTRAFGDVAVGDEIPPFLVELTPTLIAGGALATQDHQDVHHDRDIANRRGHPDIFMNIITSSGLVGRYVTDWAGPEALIRAFEIRLGRPNYPYDEVRLNGVVTELRPTDDGGLVVIEVRGDNSLGEHSRASVEVELPAERRSL